MLDCASRLSFSLGLKVSGGSFFCGIKQAKISALSIIAFAFSHVLFGVAVKAYAKIARFVVGLGFFKVLCVGLLSSATQILVSVVRFIPINMVNILRRPNSRHKQNCTPMGVVFFACNRDFSIPAGLNPTCNVTNFGGSVVHKPSKSACGRLVAEKTTQFLCGKIASSHDALQMLIGQRLRAIRSRLGLRHFNRGLSND